MSKDIYLRTKALVGAEALEKLFEAGVGTWCVIHCPEGAWGMSRTGQFAHEPSKKLPKGYKVGSVGAGDAFCAPGYIRLSYATSDDNIREAVRRIAEALARLQ